MKSSNSSMTKDEEIILKMNLLHPNAYNLSTVIRLSKVLLKSRSIPLKSDSTYRRFCENFKKEHFDIYTFYRASKISINPTLGRPMHSIVRRGGIIKYGEPYFHEKLFDLEGERVTTNYDTNDLSKISVFKLNGELICEAHKCKKIYPLQSQNK